MNIDTVLEDFASENGITLTYTEDSEEHVEEVPYSSPSSDHGVGYHSSRWEERFAILHGFSFTVDGVTISGRFPDHITYGSINADEGAFISAEDGPVLAAIRRVCGNINYGETALGVHHG